MKNKGLVKKIPYNEKVLMTTGIDNWSLFIPSKLKGMKIRTSDGPLGLRLEENGQTKKSVAFPSPSSLACSFDKKLLYEVGNTYGLIARGEGVDLVLGPGINIKRNPLCGRNFEYFSEDPILSGELSASYIKGIQSTKTGACLKHYILNNQEYARYTVSANVDEKALHEIYLKNFMIAIKEGQPKAIMSSYNRVNHEYVNESKDLLDIPRKEWGFNGIYLSDWWAVADRRKSFLAGTDVEMPYSENYKTVFPQHASDLLSSEVLDINTDRLISFIKDLNHEASEPYDLNKAHNLAKLASANSNVLVKNDEGILPISLKEKVAIIGHLAKEPYFLGDGSARVNPYKVDSLIDSLKELCVPFTYADGYNKYMNTSDELLLEAKKVSSTADKVVLFVGNKPFHEGEGHDRSHLKMPYSMTKLIKTIYEVNKNIILIVETGAPLEIPFINQAKAAIICYLGGEAVNQGLAMNLYGIVSPSGRLAETWPISLNDTPMFDTYKNDYRDQYHVESIYVGYRYYDKIKKDVLFPFGYGLSYSKFKLSSFKVSVGKKKISVSVKVKNIGSFDAASPILLYSSIDESVTFRPVKELLDFEKVFLKKKETKEIKFNIPTEYLNVFNYSNGKMELENGTYQFMIGFDSLNLTLKKTLKIKSKAKIENITFMAEDYYKLDKKFNLESFEKLFQKKMLEDIKEVDFNSCINDFLKTANGVKVKEAIYKKIEKALKDDKNKELMVKNILETVPFRHHISYIPLYNKEEYQAVFDVVNGKRKYQEFTNLKGIPYEHTTS